MSRNGRLVWPSFLVVWGVLCLWFIWWFARWLKCANMALGINMLKNIVLLHSTKVSTHDTLPSICSRTPWILKPKTIISNIPMCHTKCHYLDIFHFKKIYLLMNNITLTISGCDTLRPIGIWFRLFCKYYILHWIPLAIIILKMLAGNLQDDLGEELLGFWAHIIPTHTYTIVLSTLT